MKVLLTAVAILLLTVTGLGIDVSSAPAVEAKPLTVCAQSAPTLNFTGTEKKKDILNAMFPKELSECLQFDDYAMLDSGLEAGVLVDIPTEDLVGFRLRLSGKFPIAQMESDPGLKVKLFRLRPAAAGLLYRIAGEFRGTIQKQFGQKWEKHYRPLEVTSLTRTWEYQTRLAGTNPNADVVAQKVPPTHVFGIAFDIGRVSLTPTSDKVLLSILTQLEKDGQAIFFKEGTVQAAYHVIATPASWTQLTESFDHMTLDSSHELVDSIGLTNP